MGPLQVGPSRLLTSYQEVLWVAWVASRVPTDTSHMFSAGANRLPVQIASRVSVSVWPPVDGSPHRVPNEQPHGLQSTATLACKQCGLCPCCLCP
jgi:hypothetical protein